MFKSIGMPEIILILLIIFIFFGVGKLPQVGEAFGKTIRNFKKAQQEDEPAEEAPAPSAPRRATATGRTSTARQSNTTKKA
jgi:sec-independent protein translocase protein TatA